MLPDGIATPITPNLPYKSTRAALYPKAEKAEHRKMYAYYQGMGVKRSLRKVAREFNRSLQTVALASKAFDWKGRLKTHQDLTQDPFALLAQPSIEKSRKDIVDVLCEITTIFSEMTDLAKGIRIAGAEKLNDEQKNKMKSLVNALSVYGISIKNPKDLRDIVGTLKDVMQFNKDMDVPQGGDDKSTKVLINEMSLVIKND